MPVCAVPTCATTHRATDKTLFKFPKDANYARIWARCCLKKDSFTTKSAYICSLHFADDAYKRDINHDVLGCQAKRNLRKDAVPTLLLPSLGMLKKNSFESLGSEDVPMLIDSISSVSPKCCTDDIKLNLFNCTRIHKFHVKFHHPYMKYRLNAISSHNCSDTSSVCSKQKNVEPAFENANSEENVEFTLTDGENSESEKHIR